MPLYYMWEGGIKKFEILGKLIDFSSSVTGDGGGRILS